MKNNNSLAVLLFVVIASFTLPFFYVIADGQFYWGIAPSLVFTILFYLQAEKTKQERNETLNSSKEYQSTLENILKQNSIESQNAINSSKQENSLSQKKVQEAIEMQTKEFNKYIKIAIESFEQTISNGIKANNEQITSLQSEVTNSIVDSGKHIVESLVLVIKDLKSSNLTNQENLNQIKEMIDIMKETNNSNKINLDKMIGFVGDFEINHKTLVDNLTDNQVDLKETILKSFKTFDVSVEDFDKKNSRIIENLIANNTITQKAYLENSKVILEDFNCTREMGKKSLRSFDSSIENLSGKLEQFVEDSIKKNRRVIEELIENNKNTQKAYLENSKKVLEDFNGLHKADEQLIKKLIS